MPGTSNVWLTAYMYLHTWSSMVFLPSSFCNIVTTHACCTVTIQTTCLMLHAHAKFGLWHNTASWNLFWPKYFFHGKTFTVAFLVYFYLEGRVWISRNLHQMARSALGGMNLLSHPLPITIATFKNIIVGEKAGCKKGLFQMDMVPISGKTYFQESKYF